LTAVAASNLIKKASGMGDVKIAEHSCSRKCLHHSKNDASMDDDIKILKTKGVV